MLHEVFRTCYRWNLRGLGSPRFMHDVRRNTHQGWRRREIPSITHSPNYYTLPSAAILTHPPTQHGLRLLRKHYCGLSWTNKTRKATLERKIFPNSFSFGGKCPLVVHSNRNLGLMQCKLRVKFPFLSRLCTEDHGCARGRSRALDRLL